MGKKPALEIILSTLHAGGKFDYQISGSARYSSLAFSPDPLGDLLYDGIAQQAYKRDIAYGVQVDSSYHLDDMHTLRAGLYIQTDRALSETTSQVLPVDADGRYQRPTGAAFGPENAIWTYSAPKKSDFFSMVISGAQRLPDGHTLICSGVSGFAWRPARNIFLYC